MSTLSLPATFTETQAGAPLLVPAGNVLITMKTRKMYSDGSTVLSTGNTYSVDAAWAKTAIENNWATDVNKVFPDSPVVSLLYAVNNVINLAPPTGSVDDLSLGSALNTAKRVLQFQAGTYLLSAAFTVSARVFQGTSRDATVIKLKDSANINALFIASSGATDIEFRDLTFDANGANQTAQSQLIDLATNANSNVRFINCRFKNLRGTGGASGGFGLSNISTTDFVIADCLFEDSTGCHLRLTGCNGGVITRNRFTNYGPAGNVSSVTVLGGASTKNVLITQNYWKAAYATQFSIESTPTGTVYHPYFTIVGNVFDGNALRGTGVSGYFSDSVISNNLFLNGADDAGSWAGQRNGIEIAGARCVITSNYIENGSIALLATSGYSNGSGNKVTGNTIRTTATTSTSVTGITYEDQDDSVVTDNNVLVNISGSATMQSGIYIGTYGVQGTINRSRVAWNVVRQLGSALGNGIRVLSTSSTDIDLADNTVSGFANGINIPSTSVDVNLRMARNNVWNNTTPIAGAPTGLGFVDKDNIKTTGALSVQTVASSSTPALNVGLGNRVLFTATSASTWGAPTNIPPRGDMVTMIITQDGTGGWTISFNAAYIFPVAFSNTGNTAGKTTLVNFISDGTKLIAMNTNSWY